MGNNGSTTSRSTVTDTNMIQKNTTQTNSIQTDNIQISSNPITTTNTTTSTNTTKNTDTISTIIDTLISTISTIMPSTTYEEKIKTFNQKLMRGNEFNSIFKNDDKKSNNKDEIHFIKLTNETETHNGFQFKDGLNVNAEIFLPFIDCTYGGIYFMEIKNAH